MDNIDIGHLSPNPGIRKARSLNSSKENLLSALLTLY